MIATMLLRLLYLIFQQVLGLALLMGRTSSSKDIELPVLRHEVAVLRRAHPRARWAMLQRSMWTLAVVVGAVPVGFQMLACARELR